MGLFGKKDKDKDKSEEATRTSLFAKSKKPTQTPAASNPYAVQQQTPDPYASTPNYGISGTSVNRSQQPPPQQQQRGGPSNGGPPAYDGNSAFGKDKTPVPPGGYNGNKYQAPDTFGQQQRGYGGGDAYGTNGGPSTSQRPGGYGGLGRSNSQDTMATDAGREALFGGAKERLQQKQAQGTIQTGLPPEEDLNRGYGGGGGGGGGYGSSSGGYGQYDPDRQLTAEEEEEEQVNGAKDQIRELKRQDVSSTRNALRLAATAEETGRATLERLGIQGEMIHNAEKNLDLSSSQNRLAQDKAAQLNRLNRSIFAPNVANPFTKGRQARDRDNKIMETAHKERTQRDATRAEAYRSLARREEHGRELRTGGEGEGQAGPRAKTGASLAERSKYQFEADSEDEAMEDEIDANLDALAGATGRLNLLGKAMGREVDSQNTHIERITGKVETVDDEILMNRHRLERIK